MTESKTNDKNKMLVPLSRDHCAPIDSIIFKNSFDFSEVEGLLFVTVIDLFLSSDKSHVFTNHDRVLIPHGSFGMFLGVDHSVTYELDGFYDLMICISSSYKFLIDNKLWWWNQRYGHNSTTIINKEKELWNNALLKTLLSKNAAKRSPNMTRISYDDNQRIATNVEPFFDFGDFLRQDPRWWNKNKNMSPEEGFVSHLRDSFGIRVNLVLEPENLR